MAMGFIEKGLVIIFICTAFHVSSILCEVYKVGGDAGWTANFDYHTWSSSKTFDVGDIIEFDYTAGDHNVIEVNHTDFRTCNQSRPVVKYTSGNDSITINKRGHYYFICGTPSHCEDGQKVDIRVVPESSKQSTTPSAPAPSNGNRVCTVSFMALLGKAATAALVIFHGFTY